MNLLSRAKIQGPCLYQRESVLQRVFFKRKYRRILSAHWKLSVIQMCPYQRGVRTERFDCSLVGEREIHLWCVYILHKMSADRGILLGDVKKMYKKVCCMCRLLVLPRSSIKCINAFLIVFIAVVVVVATALYFDLKWHSVITLWIEKSKNV